MKFFQVGGSVRDELLGFRPKDRDWVVINSSPNEMEQNGFKPIGKDFPVFLHPDTNEEYALARTERKSGVGYKGFKFYFDKYYFKILRLSGFIKRKRSLQEINIK